MRGRRVPGSGRWRELSLAAAATVAALLGFEGFACLALDAPRYHNAPLEFDPRLGVRGAPGYRSQGEDEAGPFAFELNSDGMRGRELPDGPAPPDVVRVAFVGDSFLVGQAVRAEELLTSLAEAVLQQGGIAVEVYNLGQVDYGTGQELLLLRELRPRLAPDAVVLVLYPGNDLANNSLELAGRTVVSPGDYVRPYLVAEAGELRVRFAHPARAWLRRHSRLFASLESRLLALGVERGIEWLEPWPRPRGAPERLRAGSAPLEHLELFREHDPGHPWERAWRGTFAILEAFRDECEALGARLLVLVVPSVDQVQRTAKSVARDILAREAAGIPLDRLLDWNLPENRLAAFFESEGIEAVLLLPRLREAAEAGMRPYGRDEHLAPTGHAIAARSVVDWWLRRGEDPGALVMAAGRRFTGHPVRRLPRASEAPGLLEFREQDHRDHLGDGWLDWKPERSGEAWGWRLGTRALAVLPARSGELVVRGFVPPGVTLPVEGRLGISGAAEQTFRLDAPGVFELRFPSNARSLRADAEGYVAVILSAGRNERVPAGLVVRELGFAEAGR